MKASVALLAGIGLIGTPGVAASQTRPGFSISAEVLDYAYRERETGVSIARDDGTFLGVGGSYVETVGGGVLLRARLNVALGTADYRGGGQSINGAAAGQSRLDDVSQQFGQLELHVARDFAAGNSTITPFVGVGSRYLRDESGGKRTSDGLLGYDREVSYAYVPVGVGAQWPLWTEVILAASAQYNVVIGGDVQSELSGIDAALPDIKVDLDGGSGFELTAAIMMPVRRRSVSFGPFFRSWRVDRSKPLTLVDPEGSGEAIEFFEPKSRTTELGLRLTFGF